MRELFVYYRVARADQDRCHAAVRALQARLVRERPGLVARLLARPGPTDGLATWMETYAVEGGNVDAALQSRIELAAEDATAALRHGPRHVEVFIALP